MENKIVIELYPFVAERCSDAEVLTYVKKRHEVITCSPKSGTYIDRHLQQTVEHRLWIYYAFVLISDSLTAADREKVHHLVLQHDLSKFSAVEIVGYSLKFGRSDGQELKKASHIAKWELALQHHYKENAHHPQHRADGKMTSLYLIESIIDMLACRMQRNLSGHPGSSTEDIFKVPDTFLNRYTDHDKQRVSYYLRSWSADVMGSPYRKSLGQKLLG